jgi:hypothetical protein
MHILAPLARRKQKKFPIRRKIRSAEERRHPLISEQSKTPFLLYILLLLTLLIIITLQRLLAVEFSLGSSSLDSLPNFYAAIIAATNDMLHAQVNSYPLHKLIVLVQYLDMVLLLDVPYENTLVHARRHDVFTTSSPTQVQHILRVPHQTRFGRPTQNTFRPIDGQTVLTFLPNCYAFVIRA